SLTLNLRNYSRVTFLAVYMSTNDSIAELLDERGVLQDGSTIKPNKVQQQLIKQES
ncbi:hypothetical protein HN011_009111, partial [Eciton burchellii]